jgi:hypothetical protein
MVARVDAPDGEVIAIRLGPAAETLLVGEGIETALAGTTVTGLPGWAALSTSGLAALVLPTIVRNVAILADHDRSGADARAARAAAARWASRRAAGVDLHVAPRRRGRRGLTSRCSQDRYARCRLTAQTVLPAKMILLSREC